MQKTAELFLKTVYTALNSVDKPLELDVTDSELQSFFQLSDQQAMLPMIVDTVYSTEYIKRTRTQLKQPMRDKSIQSVVQNIIRTNEFLTMLLEMQSIGLDPVIIKGVICQSLYPKPLLRISVDDDLFVPNEQFSAYHQFLVDHGLVPDEPITDINTVEEISYHKEGSPLYIELHRFLFPAGSAAYGDFNRFFEHSLEHTIHKRIQDVNVRTLDPTDHLLYLILHVFKHFLHSGIGIRSICDIGLFADYYRTEIDWNYIKECLISVNAFDYTRALFRIIEKYLFPDAEFMQSIEDWNIASVDEEPMLNDIMDSGVHGASSMSRLHSSNITLNAVKGSNKKGSILGSVFLPRKSLEGRYPYLKKAPYLLPYAWLQRVVTYLGETRHSSSDAIVESIRIGKDRVALLEQYHIIPEEK